MIHGNNWKLISKHIEGRSPLSCCDKYYNMPEAFRQEILNDTSDSEAHNQEFLKKNFSSWTIEEHEKLIKIIKKQLKQNSDGSNGKIRWCEVAKQLKTKNSSNCYDRWLFFLIINKSYKA